MRTGRPKKPDQERRSALLKVRVTEEQLERYRKAAELAREDDENLDFSDWVRKWLNIGARFEFGSAGLEPHPIREGISAFVDFLRRAARMLKERDEMGAAAARRAAEDVAPYGYERPKQLIGEDPTRILQNTATKKRGR